MRVTLTLALEDLEVDKLEINEVAAAKSSEYDVLHNEVQQKVATTRAEAAGGGSAPMDSSDSGGADSGDEAGDAGGDDDMGLDTEESGEEPDEEEPEEESEEEEPDEKEKEEEPEEKEEPAQEAFRQLAFTRLALEEGYEGSGDSALWSGAKTVVSAVATGVWSGAVFIATALTTFGIRYGPTIASAVYKGVTYAFCKCAKLIYDGGINTSKFIDRRMHSFPSLKKEVMDLQALMAAAEKGTGFHEPQGLRFSKVAVINRLKIGDSVDMNQNLVELHTFLRDVVKDLDTRIKDETAALKFLLAQVTGNRSGIPLSVLGVKKLGGKFKPGVMKGYEAPSELVDSYRYDGVLPSDAVFMARLPSENLTTIDDYVKAYNASSLFLGVDVASFKEVGSIDYMTVEALNGFLANLVKICDLCMSHQQLYERIQKDKNSLKYSFKNYFLSLANAKEKVSLEASLIEQVYLRTLFIDKVYLVAAMDIHDYAAKTLTSALTLAKDNLQKLV